MFPQGPVYTGARTFADNETGRFLEEAEKVFSISDSEDTNIGLEYRYTYSAQSGWTISSTQRYAEPVMNPPVFDAINSIPALGNLTGGISTLASSTSFSGPLGNTRFVRFFPACHSKYILDTNICRNLFASLTHYPSVELGKQGLAIMKRLTESGNLTSLSPQLITYAIPPATMQMGKVRGGNALGLDVEGHLVSKYIAHLLPFSSISHRSDLRHGQVFNKYFF